MWPLLLLGVRLEYRVVFWTIALQGGLEFVEADVKVRLELVKIGLDHAKFGLESSKPGLDLVKVVHDWYQGGLYSGICVTFLKQNELVHFRRFYFRWNKFLSENQLE